MLEDVPNRQFQDLSVIYRYVLEIEGKCLKSIPVDNSMAKRLGFSEEQLFSMAAENTRRIMPPRVIGVDDIMREIFMSEGMPKEKADKYIGDMQKDEMIWVITNELGLNGAASMLYEDKLHTLAAELESDLYIMPSSIHEVMAVSADKCNPEDLAELVSEVNMAEVSLDERLSNQVYHYDKDLRKLTLATDTPNKRLDGIVAEAGLVYETKEQAR